MTSQIPILQDGHPTLRQRSEEVVDFDAELTALAQVMIEVISEHRAQGLAAVQIGIPIRLIVVHVERKWMVMVNPVITRTLNRYAFEREGCLSVRPSLWRDVIRPAKCDITWQDLTGQHHSQTFTGRQARALQHEIDHLDGVLITDNVQVRRTHA